MVFSQGDIVIVDFEPTKGHEPRKTRPALVVSKDYFNAATSMTIVCPITSQDSGFPLHRPLPAGLAVSGYVITEQARAIDLDARLARFVDRLSGDDLEGILETVRSFF
jgi:mRNA interferase MazF